MVLQLDNSQLFMYSILEDLVHAEARALWMRIGPCWCDGYAPVPQVHNR